MADLAAYKFKADLAKFAKQIDANLATVVQKLAFDLFGKLIDKTPVDTGRARAGWGISIGTADTESVPPILAGEPNEHPPPPMPDLSTVNGKQKVWILNNVVYVEALEDGHSDQAPAGFIRISLAELELEIESMTI